MRFSTITTAAWILLLATRADARLTRASVPLTPEDNLADCLPDAQNKIKEISSNREFHYNCKDGYVVSVYLPVSKTESESPRERLNPILRNQGHLFDSEPIALDDAGVLFAVVVRRRKGLRFLSRQIDSGRRDWKEGRRIDFFDLGPFYDIGDEFSTTPKVYKDVVSKTALVAADERWPHSRKKIKNVELIIRDYCSSSDISKPELVWWIIIRDSKHKGMVSCFVSAESGEACRVNGPCDSSEDPGIL